MTDGCHVPDEYKHLRWHVIKPHVLSSNGWSTGNRGYEIAEWVNNEDNGPTEKGHWVRWGSCGDFPSLSHADYVGPFPNQEMLK